MSEVDIKSVVQGMRLSPIENAKIRQVAFAIGWEAASDCGTDEVRLKWIKGTLDMSYILSELGCPFEAEFGDTIGSDLLDVTHAHIEDYAEIAAESGWEAWVSAHCDGNRMPL